MKTIIEKGVDLEEAESKKKNLNEVARPLSKLFPNNLFILQPSLPFPQRFKKKKLDNQFAKFPKIFMKIQITIPFANALEQMLNDAKVIKV